MSFIHVTLYWARRAPVPAAAASLAGTGNKLKPAAGTHAYAVALQS